MVKTTLALGWLISIVLAYVSGRTAGERWWAAAGGRPEASPAERPRDDRPV
jgi:hypothetical protein